jgi:ABC-type multidrug transport system fused ATPase/permease subunit
MSVTGRLRLIVRSFGTPFAGSSEFDRRWQNRLCYFKGILSLSFCFLTGLNKKLRHILGVLTPTERRQFWLQIIGNVFISIADIAALVFLLLVVDFYINDQSSSRLNFLPGWMLDKGSIALIAVFFIFFSVKNIAGILISNAQFSFTGKVALRISKQKLDNYLAGDYSEFVNTDSAVHLRKIAFQPFEFCQHMLSGIQQILIHSVLILVTITAILIYNAQLFIFVLLILVPSVLLVFFYMKRRLVTTKQNIVYHNERSFQFLLDALKGYVEGNIYERRHFFHDRFAKARGEFSKHLFESLALQAIPGRVIETFAVLGLFVLILVVKWSGVNDSSIFITIGAFMAAAYKIIPGVVKIINAAGQMKAHGFSFSELEVSLKKSAITPDKGELIRSIELNDISFQYSDHQVLRNFSVKICKGDFLGIAGRSGKGKTTVFNLLLGFLTPSCGRIIINDRVVSDEELKSYWYQVSYVRQQSFLIHDTVLRNITLEENGHDEKALNEAIEISGLRDIIERSPDGLNKLITENGKNISGGQQQRIAIARAIYKRAPVLLLDEPFNELDETSTMVMLRHFKEMSENGKIIVMITHDKNCLSFCNKTISLDD